MKRLLLTYDNKNKILYCFNMNISGAFLETNLIENTAKKYILKIVHCMVHFIFEYILPS